jgi:hypothetical protein
MNKTVYIKNKQIDYESRGISDEEFIQPNNNILLYA